VAKSADAAKALVEAFFRSVPASRNRRINDADWEQALNRFHGEAGAIRKRYSLGPLGRAMATYRFQKQLLGAGFDAATVRKVVFSLVLNAFTAST
jgi:hypothetical protein